MELLEFFGALVKQKKTGRGYQIHVNTADINNNGMDVEVSDLCFTDCTLLKSANLLTFDNSNEKPISYKEDDTPLYSIHSSEVLYLDVTQIEQITEMQDILDWFTFPVSRAIDIKLKSKSSITIGFMAD